MLDTTKDMNYDNVFDIIRKSLSYVNYGDACSSILIIIAREGYDNILELILKYLKEEDERRLSRYLNCKDENERSVFINIVLREKTSPQTGYKTSLAFLKEYKEYFEIDAKDNIGNTALHYASQHDFLLDGEDQLDHTFIKTLIGNGACINVKNKEGIYVIDRLPSNMIEDFLNERIKESKDKNNENYALSMDYKFMSTENEPGFLMALQNSKTHHHLLYHPLIAIFLQIRWHQVKLISLVTPFFNFLFGFLVFIYMIVCRGYLIQHGFIDNNENMDKYEKEYEKLQTNGFVCFKIVITIFGLLLMVREITQFYLYRLKYLQSVSNYLEVTFITLTWIMLHKENYGTQQRSMAWLFVLLPICYFLIMERLHKRIAIYIHMLKKITIKYLKFLIFFLYPVGAFGICFYFSLKKEVEEPVPNEVIGPKPDLDEVEQRNESRFAKSSWESILKTFAMSTGEFNFSDLALHLSTGFIFFAFVFFVYLVCMNLLNGTAINDIQDILKRESDYHVRRQVDSIIMFDEWKKYSFWISKFVSCFDGLMRVFHFEYCFPGSDKEIRIYHNKDATADQIRYVRCNCKDHRIKTIKGIPIIWVCRLFSITKCILWFTSYHNNHKDLLIVKCEEGHNTQDQECEHLDLQDCDLGHKYMIPSEYVAKAKKILDDNKRK